MSQHAPGGKIPGIPHDVGSIVYGLREGKLIHIDEIDKADRGLKCNCRCTNEKCNARLVARKGEKKAAHFAHHNSAPCKHAYESSLHLLAKEVLDEHRRMFVPEYSDEVKGQLTPLLKGREIIFDDVKLEKPTDTIVPDVIVYVGGRKMIVEMAVTHWCDQPKIDKIKTLGLAAIELDLSALDRNLNRDEVAAQVIKEANRTWLNNPKGDEVKARRIEKLEEQELAEQKRQEIWRAKKELDALAKASKRQAAANVISQRLDQIKGRPHHSEGKYFSPRDIESYGLSTWTDVEIKGDYCFASRRWQTRIIQECVLKNVLDIERRVFSLSDAFDIAIHYVTKDFPSVIDDEIEPLVRAIQKDYRPPFQIVHAYLKYLEEERVIDPIVGKWEAGVDIINHATQIELARRAREKRHSNIKSQVSKIVDALPELEKVKFSFPSWLNLRLRAIGQTTNNCIELGGPQFTALVHALDGIEAMMFTDGAVIVEKLGLPIDPEIKRQTETRRHQAEIIQAEQEKAEYQARMERVLRLKAFLGRYSHSIIGNSWTIPIENDLSPEELARINEDGLQRAISILRPNLDAAQKIYNEELRVKGLQDRLLAECEHMRDPPRARLFLATHNPAYSGKPITTCRDERTYEQLKKTAASK